MLALLLVFVAASLILPFLSNLLGARVFWLAALVPLAAFVHTALQGPTVLRGGIPFETYEWIPGLSIAISMRMDSLGWIMALIVTGVGALVLFYCRPYFRGKKERLGVFASTLVAFAGTMYGLVLTDDLVMLVMFWEITSILSYLLIGHYHERVGSRRAATQALLVTTLGGLIMFIGVVILIAASGTTSVASLIADPPTGPLVNIAVVLLIIGAVSKSALFPLHFWLPGAMAAPTPVSAYLHAAAMVKAGLYLLARFAPAFWETPPWQPIVVILGVTTMLLGGFQALRETDLKRILAYGTVSQLGFIATVIGFGERDMALAGLALLISHALFKSALFLVVGVIDRQLSTRDIRNLHGLARQAPVMFVISLIAVFSMVGLPPTLGFAAKESALGALSHTLSTPWGWIAFVGVIAGSVLTFAYGARFIWGAFFTKRDERGEFCTTVQWPDPPIGFLTAPMILAALALAGGIFASALDGPVAGYADTLPGEHGTHLALWHGFEPALFISIGTWVVGASLFVVAGRNLWQRKRRLLPFTANEVYFLTLRGIDRASVAVTALTQRGSLPIYVATVFVVLVASEAVVLFASAPLKLDYEAWNDPVQLALAPVMIIAGVLALRARKRYTAVVLVSVTGMGMVVLFGALGAPDLALTQVSIETITLVTFALVLRRIPARMGTHNETVLPYARAALAIAVGVTMAVVVLAAASARVAEPVSTDWTRLAYEIGHGYNVVNVALVDLRGWDTMGELAVLVLAATGVASLVFVTNRTDHLSAIHKRVPRSVRRAARRHQLVETTGGISLRTEENRDQPMAWLIGGQQVARENRSILLEVVVRILFHTIIVVSLYFLFAGHNLPGGGFAGGLIAGMALVMRYIAGGPYELGIAAPRDAGQLLGIGMLMAVGTAVLPLVFAQAPLESSTFEWTLPLLGDMYFVTSTFFDIGVYLVVVGLVLDVLRSLGAEVDRRMRDEREGHLSGQREGIDA